MAKRSIQAQSKPKTSVKKRPSGVKPTADGDKKPFQKSSSPKASRRRGSEHVSQEVSSGKVTLENDQPIGESDVVLVNRAPVLTLWMSVVLERLGYERATALSAARVIAGLCAVAKGRSLGRIPKVAEASEAQLEARKAAREATAARQEATAEVAGIRVPLAHSEQGLCALSAGTPVEPAGVAAYLRSSFRDKLGPCQAVMRRAAEGVAPEVLRAEAMHLYEQFRPEWRGWGAKAELRLGTIEAAAAGLRPGLLKAWRKERSRRAS